MVTFSSRINLINIHSPELLHFLENILSSNADMPGLKIEISIIIYDLILRMMEINWIFQLVDGIV